MNKPMKFVKDGKERYISNLREFIELIYDDNQRINKANINKLFSNSRMFDNNFRVVDRILKSHSKKLDRLCKMRSGKFIFLGVAIGVVGWYRTHKLEKRIKELEDYINNLKDDDEYVFTLEDDLIFDDDTEEEPKEE